MNRIFLKVTKMKKLILSLTAVATVFLLSFNISLNKKVQPGDINLLQVKINEANAACEQSPINNGRCSYMGNCFPSFPPPDLDCDSTKG